jgi:acyl-CoA synthetase (AMP-forming)/AMP-acid ligase II
MDQPGDPWDHLGTVGSFGDCMLTDTAFIGGPRAPCPFGRRPLRVTARAGRGGDAGQHRDGRVLPRPSATDEAEVIAFCRQRLAHYKCPAAVRLGELPKTSTVKVQKYLLRDHEWAGHETRIK